MNSDTKGGLAGFYIVATIFLSIWFGFSLKDGLDRYIQFPKNHQITQCLVNSTDVIKWSYSKFQVIWTVNYNDTQSEKISKIFLTNYTTYTDAIEATNNQYQIGQVYTCFFNKNKPYDLLWTVDDTVTSGKRFLILAIIFGILLFVIWIIPISYFGFKCCRHIMTNLRDKFIRSNSYLKETI
ncbi:hypothetical protein I4U23_022192 [Adineta vaga]|nr:hypothetical protein I4U23_022192 [Adineta vaga]